MSDPEQYMDDFLALREKHWDYLFDKATVLTQDPTIAASIMDETFLCAFRAWRGYAKNPDLNVRWWLGVVLENVHKNLNKY